ncbi:MAG TPA: hypothetical protein VFM98_02750 [Ramlibacter sp.]|uniref:hypothetical protein n=1 Tax=Ramlibacter sp. TaxID=1917967 RepID=UPI002D7FD012|nr:hypothetical protein [Ramlibacter sp.]HET8744496.1 hypothetical protein [Ramlibacter sp.]
MFSHSPEQAAIARQIAQELTAYEDGLRELLLRRWDPELYRALSDRFDRMQMQATLLPKLGASWTELLISRVDLMHALWTLSSPSRINGKVVAFHAKHTVLVEEVRRKCHEYVAKERVDL